MSSRRSSLRRIVAPTSITGIRNVHPHGDEGGGGGVEFYLEIDWTEPLNVVTDVTVFDAPEQDTSSTNHQQPP
jgi:hypothetical protein